MAEGFLKSFDPDLIVYSAGTNPAQEVHPFAIKVMAEAGIDISGYYTKNVNQFIHKSFDYVVTVCDNAKDTCPVFLGNVANKVHIGFEDPVNTAGREEEILEVFRKTRNEIQKEFDLFYKSINKNNIKSIT
jgi:arsenate reductase